MEEIRSSVGDLAVFMESSIFQDYVNEIDIRITQTNNLLDDYDMKYTGRQYDAFRGRKRNLEEMKDIFLDLMKNKEADILAKENDLNEGES